MTTIIRQSAGAEGPPDNTPATFTVTHYQQLASDFMKSLDAITTAVPKLEARHSSTAAFVRTHIGFPLPFVLSAIALVEQTPELAAVGKLDPVAARETLQFIEAFRTLLGKVRIFEDTLAFSLDTLYANLVADCLQTYWIAKGVARDASSGIVVESHVTNMKRTLGKKGLPRKKSTTPPQAPVTPATT
ncbi:MAG TPA: hypothetical protein VMU84_00220 [Thermoanaerobaculia bacterium]|nr:hypothetical protein [Thermoanaerobaculia bacterium]